MNSVLESGMQEKSYLASLASKLLIFTLLDFSTPPTHLDSYEANPGHLEQ